MQMYQMVDTLHCPCLFPVLVNRHREQAEENAYVRKQVCRAVTFFGALILSVLIAN